MSRVSVNRRHFMATIGAAGAGAAWAASTGSVQAEAESDAMTQVGKRPLGKTGIEVPMLSLGGSQDLTTNQLLLRQSINMGASYWDTSAGYAGGNSEQGIGMYFDRNPSDRKKVFLVSKASGAGTNTAKMTEKLDQSFDRMNTDYIDLYFIHGLADPDKLDRDVMEWADRMKREGKIKFFGFSTHKNMEVCLEKAAQCGFIDAVMTTFNYRVMNQDAFKKAVDACMKAGVGITAMKTQAHQGKKEKGTPEEEALLKRFTDKGFTAPQAKLRAVWDHPGVSCICSQITTVALLMENAGVAMGQVSLDAGDRELMDRYAKATCSGYCAGCGYICENAVNGKAPVSDIMRYLMYYSRYGEPDYARELYAELPQSIRRAVAKIDYSAAEARCPQGISIGAMMKRADQVLA